MGFKAKSTAVVDPTTGEAAPAKLNLSALFDTLNTAFATYITESQAIPDSILDPEVQEALKGVADLVGFKDYNPQTDSTYYMLVKDDGGKQLYGPKLAAYGASAAIIWSQKVVELPEEASLSSDTFTMVPEEYGAKLFVDMAGYCMPISVSLLPEHGKVDAWKIFKTKMMTLRTAGAIAEYLNRGEPLLKWSDVADGESIEFHQITPVMGRDDEAGKVKYYRALALRGETPVSMYCPGELEQWNGVEIGDEPIVLTKRDGVITDAQGSKYEVKGSFGKLADLAVGVEHKVVGFTNKADGKFGPETLIDVITAAGEPIKVNGNMYLKQRLASEKEGSITPANPGTLIIDSIIPTKNGGKKVNCRLTTASDTESPMMQKLKARQAELAKAKEPELPFV